MRRNFPEVRALYERVRRPAIMVLVGVGLTAPMGLTIVRPEAPAQAPEALNDIEPEGPSANDMESSSHASAVTGESAEPKSVSAEEERRAREEANRAATTDALVRRYAKRFRISNTLADEIHRAAVAEGIDPGIAFGLVHTESSFRRTVISSAGAVGYTQLLPSTARWIAPGTSRSDLFNTRTNLRVGFKYLNYLLDKYDGNTRLALTAYNRGPGTVDRLIRQGRNPENGYATKVLRAARG